MRKARRARCGILLLAMTMGPGAAATYSPGASDRLSVNAGAAIPVGTGVFARAARIGPMVGFSYMREFGDFFGGGVQADYARFEGKGHDVTSASGGRLNVLARHNIAALELMGRSIPYPQARLRPYIHGGLGLTHFTQSAQDRPPPGFTWADTNTRETRRLESRASIGFSFSIGLGLESNISRRLVLGIESAWRVFEVDPAALGSRTLTLPTLSLRLSRRLGPRIEEGPADPRWDR